MVENTKPTTISYDGEGTLEYIPLSALSGEELKKYLENGVVDELRRDRAEIAEKVKPIGQWISEYGDLECPFCGAKFFDVNYISLGVEEWRYCPGCGSELEIKY